MKAFFLVGATATGKSSVAHHIARSTGRAILSADSMLIYRGMDIGTAKPTPAERDECCYGGIDLVDPGSDFSVWEYRQRALQFLHECRGRAQEVIVVGGTGLYVKALLEGLAGAGRGPSDRRGHWEELAAREGVQGLRAALAEKAPADLAGLADPMNPRRLIRALERAESPGDSAVWRPAADLPAVPGLWRDAEGLDRRIRKRVDVMLETGLLAEVAQLRARAGVLSHTARQAIGYAEFAAVLDGECTEEDARERTVVRTRRLAKKQRTWFRHQLNVAWIEVEEGHSVASAADRVQEFWREHGAVEIAKD